MTTFPWYNWRLPGFVAVDPGPEKSAVVRASPGVPLGFSYISNQLAMAVIGEHQSGRPVIIEDIEPRGLPLGHDVAQTLRWIGRFDHHSTSVLLHPAAIKAALCGSAAVTDASIRTACCALLGGERQAVGGIKCPQCKGKGWRGRNHDPCSTWEVPPGPLYELAHAADRVHLWRALAVGLAWLRRTAQIAA